MATALIGWSGFVGSNLDRAHAFDARFRRSDVSEVSAQRWGLVVCAGLPAEKWRINQDPQPDLDGLHDLERALAGASIDRLVIISTVDVYPDPVAVDEQSWIDIERCEAYGRHRLMFERWAGERFVTTVLRLPGLFGRGLKKNAVYDLMHGNRLDKLHADARFQLYPVDRLWSDVNVALAAGLDMVNLATEPVTIRDVAVALTGRPFHGRPADVRPTAYDMRTRHGAAYGRSGPYLLSSTEVLASLRTFAASPRDEMDGRSP